MTLATTRLKRVVTLRAGGTPVVDDPRLWVEPGSENGTPWVAISDMSDGSVVTRTQRWVTGDGLRERRLAVAEPGTLLFAMYASVGAVAELGVEAAWNQALLGVRPISGLASKRFVRYWLLHLRPSLTGLVRSNTQDNLNAEQVGNFPFPVMDVAQQRAIADYLDTETPRIDAVIAKKRRLVGLLEERRASLLMDAMRGLGLQWPTSVGATCQWSALPLGWRVIRFSQIVTQLTNGYVGPTRDILQDEGIRYIQSLHIKAGRIEFGRHPFYVSDEWHRQRPRVHLREGDVLIVQTGDIGQVAVVPPLFGEASCHALQIARVNTDLISGEYLGAYLRTPFGYQSLLSRATGALHPHLEGGIRDIPIVVPPLATQTELLTQVKDAEQVLVSTSDRIARQADLLREHRQALITAAVTGALRVAERAS